MKTLSILAALILMAWPLWLSCTPYTDTTTSPDVAITDQVRTRVNGESSSQAIATATPVPVVPTPNRTIAQTAPTQAPPLVNPQALPFQPTRNLNLGAFPYDRKDDLREILETRMQGLDRGIEQLRATLNSKPDNGGEIMQQRLSDVALRFNSANERLEGIEAVEAQEWGSYKRVLRDEIASLEEAYQRLQVAVR